MASQLCCSIYLLAKLLSKRYAGKVAIESRFLLLELATSSTAAYEAAKLFDQAGDVAFPHCANLSKAQPLEFSKTRSSYHCQEST